MEVQIPFMEQMKQQNLWQWKFPIGYFYYIKELQVPAQYVKNEKMKPKSFLFIFSVICDNNKIDDRGCNGAPDMAIEIVSKSSQHMDYLIKLFKYRTAGVREYWIVNPMKRTVLVYIFGKNEDSTQYVFEDDIPVGIYSDLTINLSELLN